jgi:hypothetical protein
MKISMLPALLAPLALVAALVPGADASTDAGPVAASAAAKPVYWIDLGGQASQHPDYVFFTANAGGYMRDVVWTDWGKRKTVARGTFGTTSPCDPDGNGPEGGGPPCPDGPAKIVMRKPVKCTPTFGSKKGKKVRVYRHATIWYPDGEGGTIRTNITDRAGWLVCKESR